MKKISRGIPGSRITSTLNGEKRILENASSQRKLKRRIPLLGFPIEKKFQTQKEINTYLNGDRIVCLLCGRWFKYIGNSHLRTHGINIQEYKRRYGLPYNQGICSKEYRERKSKIGKQQYWNGNSPLADPEIREKGSRIARAKNKNRQYRVQPFNKIRMSKTHLSSPVSTKKIPVELIKFILKWSKLNKTSVSKIIKNTSIMSRSTFYYWKKKHNLIES